MRMLYTGSAQPLGKGIISSRGRSVNAVHVGKGRRELTKEKQGYESSLERKQARALLAECGSGSAGRVERGWCPQGTVPFCLVHVTKAL